MGLSSGPMRITFVLRESCAVAKKTLIELWERACSRRAAKPSTSVCQARCGLRFYDGVAVLRDGQASRKLASTRSMQINKLHFVFGGLAITVPGP